MACFVAYEYKTWRDMTPQELADALAPIMNAESVTAVNNLILADDLGNLLADDEGNLLEGFS